MTPDEAASVGRLVIAALDVAEAIRNPTPPRDDYPDPERYAEYHARSLLGLRASLPELGRRLDRLCDEVLGLPADMLPDPEGEG